MIVGAILVGVIVVLGVVTLGFNNKPKTNETLKSAGDMKRMLNIIYKNLEGTLPELTTEEIDLKETELVESLTGLKSTDDINTLVV